MKHSVAVALQTQAAETQAATVVAMKEQLDRVEAMLNMLLGERINVEGESLELVQGEPIATKADLDAMFNRILEVLAHSDTEAKAVNPVGKPKGK
jgi:hypothetical protein